MECKNRRPSYQQAHEQMDVSIAIPDNLLIQKPRDSHFMKFHKVNGKFLASDGCNLLEMDMDDKTVQQFHEFQKLLILAGLRFEPRQNKYLILLKFLWLYFAIALGFYTIGYDFYQMFTNFNPKTAPIILLYGSAIVQATLIMLLATHWQRNLDFESFFHIYHHSKIEGVDFYEPEHELLLKNTSRKFWVIQIFSLFYLSTFLWFTWAEILDEIVDRSYRYTYYFPQLSYVRSILTAYYFMIACVSFCTYLSLTNALHIEAKKFNWKILQLQIGTSTEMRQQLEELIKIHAKLCRCIRSMDNIFKVFAFGLTACVIPTIILVLAQFFTRATIPDSLLITPTVAFCVMEYFGIMYPTRIHEELSKSKALLCMNYDVWVPYEESVHKVANTLVMHLDQADLGISLWGFTIISKPLILTV